MKKVSHFFKTPKGTIIIILGILLLAFFLRFNNYAQYPQRGASSDEYSYTFLGLSLIKEGVPTSWSSFSTYNELGNTRDLTIRNLYFPIVTPYFDHPPLNGILVATWALINGESEFEEISLSTIRMVPIFLGIFTAYLVYLLSIKLFDRRVALWALLIYSTSTIIVMNTRVVFAENLLTPIFLISILIFLSVKKRASIFNIITLGILSGLAFWTKELGVVVFVSIFLLFLLEKKKPYPILFTIIFALFFFLYGLYGYIYNWELFLAILGAQSLREIGPQTLQMIFFKPIIVNKPYFDGWYFLGFVSFFTAFRDFEKYRILLIPSFVYFFFLLFSLTRHGEMGWYMIPLFPFFSILTSAILLESIKSKGKYIFVVTTFIGLYLIQYLYEDTFGLTNPQFRILLAILFLPLLIPLVLKREKLFQKVSTAWFFIFILLTIYLTYSYIHPA